MQSRTTCNENKASSEKKVTSNGDVMGGFAVLCVRIRAVFLRIGATVVGLGLLFLPASAALANCTIVGVVVNCDAASPNPYTTMIGVGPPSTNFSVTLQSGATQASAAQVVTGPLTAIQLGNNSTITIGENAYVSNSSLGANNPYGFEGMDTIEIDGNTNLTINKGALVLSLGSDGGAEAINAFGDGDTITNYGTIQGTPGSALFFANSSPSTGRQNVVDNFGTIIAGANNLAYGAFGNPGVVFTQETGAVLHGNLIFDNGDNTLHIYTGSTTNGLIVGGAGNNLLILDGEGTDTLSNTFTRFGTLHKQGVGTWTLTGSPLSTSTLTAEVIGGSLVLTGNNAAFSGTMTVDPAGTLSGAAASIMPLVTDNGLVQFNQQTNGTYTGTIMGSGNMQKIGPAALLVDNNEPYTGSTTVTQGTLAVGSYPGSPGTISGNGPTLVEPNGTLTGYGSITGMVINNGVVSAGNAVAPLSGGSVGTLTIGGMDNRNLINLAGNAPGNTLSVSGNYVGSQQSTLMLGTVLNAGGPLANQFTDRLLVGGNAAGTTSLLLKTMSMGEATGPAPNPSAGISVVQVGGASSPNAFALPNGFITGGSPFLYHLNAYGPGSPNGSADPTQNLVGNPGGFWDFRLQSVYEPGGPPTQPFRLATAPQVASYLSAPIGLFAAQFEDISELHRRLGEIRVDNQTATHKPEEVFIRAYGNKLQYATDQSFSNFGFNFSERYAATQMGANHTIIDNARGKLRGGLAGMLGHVWLKPSETVKSKASLNSQTLAAIFTWEAREEWYVDAILAGGLFSGPVTPAGRGSVVSLSGDTLAGSLEVGYPYDMGWQQLVIEPELQIVYGRLKFARETDLDQIPVDLGKQSQTTLRVGARVLRELSHRPNMHLTSYAEANWVEDLSASHRVLVGNLPFQTGSYGSTVQLRGGVNGNISQRFSVFSDLAWQFRVGTSGLLGWGLNLGLRYTF